MPRKSKSGVVYLLSAYQDGLFYYKWGASTKSAQSRVRYANSKANVRFEVLCEIKCGDIFAVENRFRWGIVSSGVEYLNIEKSIECKCGEIRVYDCGQNENLTGLMQKYAGIL